MQKIFSHRKEINFIFTELFIILKIEYPADSIKKFLTEKKLNFISTELFIILNKVEYPTDSIMNNSVKIKFNFFSVRKYFLHINLIIPGKFLFFP